MKEEQLTEQESLRIIQQMINTAKQEQRDNGKSWIVWGWLLFLASLFTFLNEQQRWTSPYFFWNVFGVCSIVLLVYQTVRYFMSRRTVRVRTYTEEILYKLNSGFFISLMLIIVAINVDINPARGFGLLLGLYGFWILIYGTLLNFRPSVIGAYITWAFAFASLFVDSFATVMLLHAAAVLCGYVIPGHLANKEFNKLNQTKAPARV
jgi:hypothetical protein